MRATSDKRVSYRIGCFNYEFKDFAGDVLFSKLGRAARNEVIALSTTAESSPPVSMHDTASTLTTAWPVTAGPASSCHREEVVEWRAQIFAS